MEAVPPVVRVLHLGGEPDRAEAVADHLEREDGRFNVELAADIDGALDRLAETEFDCVVSERGPRVDPLHALERVREALHDIATSIQTAETVEAASEQTVAAAADVLDFHMCTVVLREGDWLVPYATSEDAPAGGSRRMRVDQGLAGRTYQSGESYVIDEVSGEESDPANPSYRSGLSVPIGEYGVFQAVSTELAAFDEDDLELAELLVSHTANAIDRIEREAELKRQNERLDRFASIASHDLRNPLNVARGRLDLAREERDGPHLESVDRAHDRMEALIEDLLRLAREDEAVTQTEAVDLAELTRDCWRGVGTDAATVAVEVDGSIRADRQRLRRLLENLLRNAVEHGSAGDRSGSDDAADGASVTVGTLDGGFYVEDDGPGIPEDEREDVFEAGYSTSEDGTGLGLNIVARTAEAHGWDVRVTEGERGGARFEVTGVEPAD